jgi:hypothetical protein
MAAEQAVAAYYDAWRTRGGDVSEVPLADDFRFLGPVASFETAEGFREIAARPGRRRIWRSASPLGSWHVGVRGTLHAATRGLSARTQAARSRPFATRGTR